LIPAAVFCLVPLLLIVIVSFSDEKTVLLKGYSFTPEKWSVSAYEQVFKSPGQIVSAYGTTLTVTVLGTLLGMALTSTLAYVASRRDYVLSRATSFYVFFTMLFSGGLVPWYMLVTQTLHLKDTIFALFVPYLVVPWFVLLMRTFFAAMPFSLIESAKMEGAGELRIFVRIILPLAKPMLATISLFFVLMFWNDYWLSLMFIESSDNITLQFLLYRIMSNIDFLNSALARQAGGMLQGLTTPTITARMALAVVAAGPMLVIFPFFQRYFVRGLTVGAVKG
jgi:putative aldouronate transport system permease protein